MQDNNIASSTVISMAIAEAAGALAQEDKVIKVPFFVLYSVSFTAIYTLGAVFLLSVYFIQGFTIPWLGLFIFSFLVSLSISLVLFLMDKLKN